MSKLSITSKQEGFYRAGRPWTGAPTQVDSDEFSKEQLAALKAEPMLEVKTIATSASKPATKKKTTTKKS